MEPLVAFRALPMVALLAVAAVLYLASLAIWRLYLCPVAKFPGPKLAALTFWYEFYYDVIRQGRYTWKIRDLHEQYGASKFPLAQALSLIVLPRSDYQNQSRRNTRFGSRILR